MRVATLSVAEGGTDHGCWVLFGLQMVEVSQQSSCCQSKATCFAVDTVHGMQAAQQAFHRLSA
jgi:hypothetical protein